MKTFRDYMLLRENAEQPAAADINAIAAGLKFLPTSKKKITYRFVTSPENMPPLSYTVAEKSQPVVTMTADGKETQNVAEVNDIIMSGPSQEQYVLKAAKFPKLYSGQIGGPVTTDQSPRMVAHYTGQDTVMFKAPWGEDMVLKPNDYLVKQDDGQHYRIAKLEYEQTYNPPGKVG